MTRILIPRSDNTSAKTIEASDWEKYFTSDFLLDYKKSGLCVTAQCPNILAVNISCGKARVNGIYVENTTTCSVTCLTAATVAATGTVTIACPIACDTVTVNGLVYTGVVGCKANNTQFTICGTNCAIATDLACSVTADTRCGTLNDVTGAACAAVVTLTTSVAGTVGNATTLVSSCGTTLAVSGATFSGGTDATNKIYIQICRDPSCEPQGFIFGKTTGALPVDSFQIATVITTATTVSSVSQEQDTDTNLYPTTNKILGAINKTTCCYTSPCTATASSTSTCGTRAVLYEQLSEASSESITTYTGLAISVLACSILNCNGPYSQLVVRMAIPSGSPTGVITGQIWDASYCITNTWDNININTLSGCYQDITFTAPTSCDYWNPTSAARSYLGIKRTSGSGSCVSVKAHFVCGGGFDGQCTRYGRGVCGRPVNDQVSGDLWFKLKHWSPVVAINCNLCENWQSNSEVNPYLQIDMGSCVNISALALHPEAASNVCEVKIQVSSDACTWTDLRTIAWSNITECSWNYIRLNISTSRYVRIYGNDAGSKILSINEVKVLTYTPDELSLDHVHVLLDPDDTSIPL